MIGDTARKGHCTCSPRIQDNLDRSIGPPLADGVLKLANVKTPVTATVYAIEDLVESF
jgi:hypothetical protein